MAMARMVLLALVLAAGCQRVGVAPPVSVAACGAPGLATAGWALVRDSAGVAYRLPPGFTERSGGDTPFRQFSYEGELSGRITVAFSPSREYYTTLRRTPSPGMHEMSECVETRGGRQLLLQTWRTEGGRFRDGERSDLFEVLVLVPVAPMRTLYVTGGGSAPDFQEVVLAVARGLEVDGR